MKINTDIKVEIDDLGRVKINDQELLDKVSGAVQDSFSILGDNGCHDNGGCGDAECGNAGCQ